MFNINLNIEEFISKNWPTKTGYFITSLSIVFFVLTVEHLISQICDISISLKFTLIVIFTLLFLHDILWRLFSGRVVLFVFNKIKVAIHPKIIEKYSELQKTLMLSLREKRVGCWFKIYALPKDILFDSNEKAEKYLLKNRLELLIWGEYISGLELGKEVTEYKTKFSYSFSCPTVLPSLRFLLLRDFNKIIRERYWRISRENSLKDISSLGESIAEVSLYIIAICLLSRGSISRGLTILEELYLQMKGGDSSKRRLSIYPRVKNHLISLYNLLSIIAWTEEKNLDKSAVLCKKTLSIDENNYDAHVRLAIYEYRNNNLLGSRRHVRRCRNINPRHPCTIFDQAFFFILDKRYDRAADMYKRLRRVSVDGLLAFEVANFLEEEYLKNKKEIAFLFAAGFVNTEFVGHKQIGLRELRSFHRLARGREEYRDFYNIAQPILDSFRKKKVI